MEDQAGRKAGPAESKKKAKEGRWCTAPIPRVGVTVALIICYGIRGRWRDFFFTLRPWHNRLRHELLGRHPIPAHRFPLQFIARF